MMNRNQQIALLGGLAVVMALVWGRALRRPTPQASAVPGAAPTFSPTAPEALLSAGEREALPQATPAQSAARTEQRQLARQMAWDRDPFTFAPTAAGLGGLALSGILWDPQQPMAIINGDLRHVGDALDGYRITAITSDQVSLTDGTQTYTLTISP